jgi:hypothetical protein
MNSTAPRVAAARRPGRAPVTLMGISLLAIVFGLCGGYLDVAVLFFKKYFWNAEGHIRTAVDFPWTVPVGHVALTLVPAIVIAGVNRLRPDPVSLRATSWLLATIAIWSALLRMPLFGQCSLLFAVGLGRVISVAVAAGGFRPRLMRSTLAILASYFSSLPSSRRVARGCANTKCWPDLHPRPQARATSC